MGRTHLPDPVPYAPGEVDAQPPMLSRPFVASRTRAPSQPLVRIPQTLTETAGPGGTDAWAKLMGPAAADLTRQHAGVPLGERIVLSGRVLDENARAVSDTVVELVQANSAGRYAHTYDQHDAPLDPNFSGVGRAITDADGRYRFVTVKPGAYPWANGPNTWRPAHIHFSVFGPAFATRLVTQMYFPGDPLMAHDPIYNSIRDDRARQRMVAAFDFATAIPSHALGYKFDIVLRGPDGTPMETTR
jgi:protocatechuate 3,4-dioxygenase beta subunit